MTKHGQPPNASAAFDAIVQNLDVDPSMEELEWRFEFTADSSELEANIGTLFELIATEMEADEDRIGGEMHTYEDASNDEATFIVVFTGSMTRSALVELHSKLAELCERLSIQYGGADAQPVGAAGSGDEAGHDKAIAWTEQIVEQTSDWQVSELTTVATSIREAHLTHLQHAGLQAADWMPDAASRYPQPGLRPHEEIARRLMAAMITTAWIYAPAEIVSSQQVKDYIRENGLKKRHFAERELEWMQMKRDEAAQFQDRAGWITENIWSLAWLLGEAPIPTIHGEPVGGDIMDVVRRETLGDLQTSLADLVVNTELQPIPIVVTVEDFLYCAHNALRSLALEDSELIAPMGYVQERRQSLTWALSPETSWDDTDVST